MNRNISINNQSIPTQCGLGIRLAHKVSHFLLHHSFKGSGIIRKTVVKLFLPTPKGILICPTNYGFDIIVDPVLDKGWEERTIYSYGTYEAGTIFVMENCLRPGDVFIDVGGNIGFMSLAASKFVGNKGHVYSFEPEPETFAILKNNIEINELKNISASNLALGSAKEKATIYSDVDKNKGEASLIKNQSNNAQKESEISIETLDNFATTNDISNIRMIKIDVQGWELEVLKGANNIFTKPNAPIICIEYSKWHKVQNGELLDIYNYITSNDYMIFKLEKGKVRPSKLIRITGVGDLPHHDNLFCFLPTHLESLKNKKLIKS